MRLRYACPACEQQLETDVTPPTTVRCRAAECSWTRPVDPEAFDGDTPQQCLVCGCNDLWRQKDFPQWLGLTFLGLQIIISTILWANYMIIGAFSVMGFFALVDLVLFAMMGDMLVCYRCRARHRKMPIGEDHPNFDLEVAERYRQQQLRMNQTGK